MAANMLAKPCPDCGTEMKGCFVADVWCPRCEGDNIDGYDKLYITMSENAFNWIFSSGFIGKNASLSIYNIFTSEEEAYNKALTLYHVGDPFVIVEFIDDGDSFDVSNGIAKVKKDCEIISVKRY